MAMTADRVGMRTRWRLLVFVHLFEGLVVACPLLATKGRERIRDPESGVRRKNGPYIIV